MIFLYIRSLGINTLLNIEEIVVNNITSTTTQGGDGYGVGEIVGPVVGGVAACLILCCLCILVVVIVVLILTRGKRYVSPA